MAAPQLRELPDHVLIEPLPGSDSDREAPPGQQRIVAAACAMTAGW